MKKLLLVGLLTLLPASAHAQCNGVFPDNTVCGNVGAGVARTPRATNPSAFLGAAGGTNGQVQYNNGGALGGFTASGDATINTSTGVVTLVPGAANTLKGTINGTTITNLPVPACDGAGQSLQWTAAVGFSCVSAGAAGSNIVFPSRAAAVALDLTGFTAIATLGYATPGDGGGSVFLNIGSAPFIDSFITTFTITGGSGYTDGGPYYGNIFQVGTKPFAIGTVTVSGGAFTAVDISGTPSNLCAVGDVLPFIVSAAAVGGVNGGMPAGGTGGSITVTGCSTPLGSFTDAAGNRWQIVPQPWANIKQFSAKGDWNGTDASATDNFNAIQAALWFASFKSSTSFDSGGFWGGRVDVPQGSYMALGTGLKPLIVPNGVEMWGGTIGSTIKFGTAWDTATVQMTLGDTNWHFACFNNSLHHMELRSDSGTAYMVYSSCGQDFAGLYQTYIYGNGNSARPCLHYEKGYGGASTFVVRDLSCSANSNSPQVQIGNTIASGMNVGTTMVELTNFVMGGNSGPTGNHQTAHALTIHGGFVNVNRFHFESTGGGIRVAVGATGNAETITINNVNGGGLAVHAPCTGMITLDGVNTPGNTVISQVQTSGTCTHVVENGQAGGTNYDLAIKQPAYFDPDYTSF
jgi:hypothetical protein